MSNSEPFYWIRPEGYPPEQCVDEGWYQWTERGIVYLGDTVNGERERAEAAEARAERLERAGDAMYQLILAEEQIEGHSEEWQYCSWEVRKAWQALKDNGACPPPVEKKEENDG